MYLLFVLVRQEFSALKRRHIPDRPDEYFFFFFFFFTHIYFPASGQAVVTGVVPSPLRFLPFIFIFLSHIGVSNPTAHRLFIECCYLTLSRFPLSASQVGHNKKSSRVYRSMHSGGFELTKLTYTRLEDNLIRHRGDRQYHTPGENILGV